VIEQLQEYLADAITTGGPTERKAAIETLIAEVRITDEGVIPVFRIPTSPPPPSDDETPATTNGTAVRTMARSGRWGAWGSNPEPTD
jgi:site-specific DNA recombinase